MCSLTLSGHERASEKSNRHNRSTVENLAMRSKILDHQIKFLSHPGSVYEQNTNFQKKSNSKKNVFFIKNGVGRPPGRPVLIFFWFFDFFQFRLWFFLIFWFAIFFLIFWKTLFLESWLDKDCSIQFLESRLHRKLWNRATRGHETASFFMANSILHFPGLKTIKKTCWIFFFQNYRRIENSSSQFFKKIENREIDLRRVLIAFPGVVEHTTTSQN